MKQIVLYLNQFFGQIGGEDQANCPPELHQGPLGPALGLQGQLQEAQVAYTIICGDNYMATHTQQALQAIGQMLDGITFDLFMAGPAFLAGRYGTACGEVCQFVGERYHVPTVTCMHRDNPGVEMFRRSCYILEGGSSAAAMRKDLGKMAAFCNKLLHGVPLQWAQAEGYFSRGIRRQVNLPEEQTVAVRAFDMLMKKLKGEPFETETPMEVPEPVPIAQALKDPSKARIAFVTTGGLVPFGNPDRIQTASATRFGRYSLEGRTCLKAGEWETVHGGYDHAYANSDPQILLPLDALRRLEEEGKIGALHPYFYSTVGNLTNQLNAERMAGEILEYLQQDHIDAVIFGST
mgnify:CR=1 FL=1